MYVENPPLSVTLEWVRLLPVCCPYCFIIAFLFHFSWLTQTGRRSTMETAISGSGKMNWTRFSQGRFATDFMVKTRWKQRFVTLNDCHLVHVKTLYLKKSQRSQTLVAFTHQIEIRCTSLKTSSTSAHLPCKWNNPPSVGTWPRCWFREKVSRTVLPRDWRENKP